MQASSAEERPAESRGLDPASIHNVDQRTPVVVFSHAALLGRPLRLTQHGATSPGFNTGTSSVVWPTAFRMARHLCKRPDLVRGKSVVEVGAGIGLVGGVAAALGAACTVLTDCDCAMSVLEQNQAMLRECGAAVEVTRVDWGDEVDHATALSLCPDGEGFEVVLASDLVFAAVHTDRLAVSCGRLLARRPSALVLLGFEFREEWETIGNFIAWMEEAGFQCSFAPLAGEADGESEDSDCDPEFLLYTFRWRHETG